MQTLSCPAWLYWDPPLEVFTVPWIDRPVVWYGILFVSGFILGYFLFVHILANYFIKNESTSRTQFLDASSAKRTAYLLADRLLRFIVIGTLVGARLGHVLFYDWELFIHHPLEIFKVWKGGLASHGGVVGVLIGLYLYHLSIRKQFPGFSFLRLLDFVAIPSALAACFIRLGNFMNQEIVGTPSQVPWAIVFGNAADGSLPIPRHAVQLYEAAAYFVIFLILFGLWKTKKEEHKPGLFIGLLFVLIFSARFILEFWKVHQDSIFEFSSLQAGQLLSIPFILIGFVLIYRSQKAQNNHSLPEKNHEN